LQFLDLRLKVILSCPVLNTQRPFHRFTRNTYSLQKLVRQQFLSWRSLPLGGLHRHLSIFGKAAEDVRNKDPFSVGRFQSGDLFVEWFLISVDLLLPGKKSPSLVL